MSKCPYGDHDLLIKPRAYIMVDAGVSSLTITECCAKPVTLHSQVTYIAETYEGPLTFDDWGVKFRE